MNGENSNIKHKNGFTLVELLVVIAIFTTSSIFIIAGFDQGIRSLAVSRSKITATAIANEKLEIIRNMPYADVGTTTGWPVGALLSSQTITRNTFEFIIETRVDYYDDPFDGNAAGTIVGKPRDTTPNDYKKAEISVRWNKDSVDPVLLSTLISPKGLESAENTGSLLIQVFDASGQPVPQATVHITNSLVTPSINITNTTDNEGNLQVLSLPPSIAGYNVEVTKDGYSRDSTYAIDLVSLPHPVKPNLTIVIEDVTEASFAIDRVSSLTINTVDDTCQPIPNISLSIWGEKLIGTDPDVLKYSSEPPTNEAGTLLLNNLEWDNYTLLETSTDYDIAGIIPPVLLSVLPNTSQTTSFVLAPHTTNSLRVSVKDAGTDIALTSANVRLTKTGYDEAKLTGYGFFLQNDWSGGDGQSDYTDPTKYDTDSGTIDTTSTSGSITLDSFTTTGSFFDDISTENNRDALATSADWNTGLQQIQLADNSGEFMLTGIAQTTKLNSELGRLTKATITVSETLNGQAVAYYLSADGGINFEPVLPGTEHVFIATGGDLIFKTELSTADPMITPSIQDITISYSIDAYQTSGSITSSSFNTGTASTFGTLTWTPFAQQPETGTESVRVQIATNNDNATWNFVGPDGTSGTYYTTSGTQVHESHNDNQYVKYKILLSTEDVAYSPIVSNIQLGYTSACIPPGQVFFSSLDATTYSIDISLTGYQTLSTSVTVNGTTQSEYFLNAL
ncbi:MAG: carboxypeptidase regulatory-like domain-containing protein [Patescibacteria group bacterium]|jgi:prepilin-type N-terminal cleavage/methylation domain-containing protein